MPFITDNKRAKHLGSARKGSVHHWVMTVTSVALLFLIPSFIFTFGQAVQMNYTDALQYYSRPYPAVVAILTLAIGFHHFAKGMQTILEDYIHNESLKWLIIAVNIFSYGLMFAGIFALLRITL